MSAELRVIAQVVHTVRTRGGVGELPGVRIERVEDGATPTMRRLEEARGVVERVRAVHVKARDLEWACEGCSNLKSEYGPMVPWPCPTIKAIDGGTEGS